MTLRQALSELFDFIGRVCDLSKGFRVPACLLLSRRQPFLTHPSSLISLPTMSTSPAKGARKSKAAPIPLGDVPDHDAVSPRPSIPALVPGCRHPAALGSFFVLTHFLAFLVVPRTCVCVHLLVARV